MKKFLKFLLILVLLLVVLFVVIPVGYFLIADFDYYDPYAPGFYQPMASEERFSFSPGEDSMELRLDKADLYWYAEQMMGGEDLYSELNKALSYVGFTLDKTGVDIRQDGIFLCARVRWKGLVPIPVGCTAELRQLGEDTIADIRSVHLGKWITLSADQLARFWDGELSFKPELKEEHPFFALCRKVTTSEGAVVFSCHMPEEWLLEKMPPVLSDYTIMLDFVKPEDIDPSLVAMLHYTEGDRTGIDAILRSFADDPAGFEQFKKDYLAIAGVYAVSGYFQQSDWNARFFPTITQEAVRERSAAILGTGQAIYDARMAQISAMELQALGYVADGSLRVSGSGYRYTDGREFTPDTLDNYAGLEDWLDVTTLRLVQAVNPGDYLQLMVGKRNKIPVFIARTYTGRPVVFFQYTRNQFRVQSLTEEDYLRYMQSRTVPTVDLGMHTTQ